MLLVLPVGRPVLHDIFIFTRTIIYGWPQEVRSLLFGHPWPPTISVCMPTSELTTPDLRCIQGVELIPRIMLTGAIFNIKTLSSRHMNSIYKDETVSRPSHLYKGNFYTAKTTSWYWISILVVYSLLLFFWRSTSIFQHKIPDVGVQNRETIYWQHYNPTWLLGPRAWTTWQNSNHSLYAYCSVWWVN